MKCKLSVLSGEDQKHTLRFYFPQSKALVSRRCIQGDILKKEVDREKYKELYLYMKDAFSDENQRYIRLEEKAMKYLASITLAVAAFVILLRWSISELIPPTGYSEYGIIFFALLTLFSLSYSWYFLFTSIKLQTLVKMPSGLAEIETFKKHKVESIYLAYAKRFSEGTKIRTDEYNHKLINVRKGYKGILFSANSFLIFVILLIVHNWK